MTRIIAGRLRGTSLAVPPAGTRPTTDRVREALFSAIDSRIDLDDAAVLDLFAGSGALGIEALSRGASHARFVESDGRAAKVLARNLAGIDTGAHGLVVVVTRGALPGALTAGTPRPGGYDLVLADPPYESSPDLEGPVLTALAEGGWLAPDALVVWESSVRGPDVAWPEGYSVEFDRRYGETAVAMAGYTPPEG